MRRQELIRRHGDLMVRYSDYHRQGDKKNRDDVMKEYLRVAKQGGLKVNENALK